MDKPSTPVLPVLHMNGSGKDRLVNEVGNAHAALTGARDTMRGMGPNERDYYPVPGLFEKARAQHWNQIDRLNEIIDELQAICDGIYAGGHKENN